MMNRGHQQTDFYTSIQLHGMHTYNEAIYHSFLQMNPDDYDKQSHFFHGRYENIYINEKKIPALAHLLDRIEQEVVRYLKVHAGQIKMGFWLNVMRPGDTTTRHCHDDLDEVLSGVYYIRVPEQSGNLIVYTPEPDEIQPQESMLVFFLPTLDHEVLRNASEDIRLSIGFNACLIGKRHA
jgi:hypothetical protein